MKDILSETLVTGSSGMVGSYVNFGIKIPRIFLDVADLNMVLNVGRAHKPKIIIHLAAETDMERCENDPDHAYRVNSIGTYNMASLAKEIGAKMVYVSTGGVFDGAKKNLYEETDIPNPKTHYGRSKHLGELIVSGMLDDYIIARACWLFGGGPRKDKKFVSKIISQLNHKEIKAANDQFGSPTFAKDFIEALCELIQKGARGIFHVANSGSVSRYEVASEIAKILGSKAKITSVSSNDFSSRAYILNQSLVSKNVSLRSWQEALRDYLETEWK